MSSLHPLLVDLSCSDVCSSSSSRPGWGTAKLKAAGFSGVYDQHGHDTNNHGGHGPEPAHLHPVPSRSNPDVPPPSADHHHHLTHSHTHQPEDAHSHSHSHGHNHSHGVTTAPELTVALDATQKKEALVEADRSGSEDSSLDDEWGVGKGKQMSGDAISQILVSPAASIEH